MVNYRLLPILLLVLSGPAMILVAGDDSPDDTTVPVIDVVITADRILTEIVSTGANVSVITADEIRASGATNLPEILHRVPGVTVRSYSNAAQAEVDMRGFGEGSSSRVLVLVDGRRQNNPDMSGINWLGIPLDRIDRIEVVRGGASALYGNHALGGVINVITTTPTAERPLDVTGSVALGSFLENQERLGLTLTGERARLRASAEHFATEGHRDRSAYRALNFSLGAGFDMSEMISLDLAGRYANVFYEMPGGLTKDEFEDDPSQARFTDWSAGGIRADNDGDEATEDQFGLDLDLAWRVSPPARAELALGYTAKLVETDTESQGSFTNRDLHTVTASPAFILDWDAGPIPMRSRLGIDWSWARQDITAWATEDREDKTYEAELSQRTLGAVLSTTAYVTERIDLGGAVRYERSTIAAEKEISDIDGDTTHQAVVFDLEAVYRPVEFAKVFLSGGTLYRYPALDEQAAVQGFGDQFMEELDPERGFTAELGGGLYLDRRLRADANAYWLEMEDEIAWVTDPITFEGANENIGRTRRLGGDLQLTSEPVDQIRLAAGYSYVMATFTDGENKGNQVPLVPNHGVDAEMALRFLPELGLEFGPAVTYRGEAYQGGDDANDQDRVEDYFLTDLFVRVRPAAFPGDLSVSAEVTNVFDVTYAPMQIFSEFSGTAYYPAPGRTFRVAASYRY